MAPLLRPAVFIDRDGILNELVGDGPPSSPDQLLLRRGAATFVRNLNRYGFLALAVTWQPQLARGTMSPVRLERIHVRLRELLAAGGARLDGVHVCPHDPKAGPRCGESAIACGCCKPAPGLLLDAAVAHRIDLRRSFMIAKDAEGVVAGRRAGVATMLLGVPAERPIASASHREAQPDHLVYDLDHGFLLIRRARDEMILRQGC